MRQPSRPILGLTGILVLGLGATAMAQPPETKAKAKAAQAARVPEGVQAERDIDYVGSGHPRQMLDLYLPEGDGGPYPAIVWIHGGGWRNGSKANCQALPLAGRGYVVASINYRLTDTASFPAQIEDCRAAIRWLRAHADEYRINPDRIGVWGASAGGHLVALLGTSGDETGWDTVGGNPETSARVQAVCDYYGPANFLNNLNPDRTQGADSPVGLLLGGSIADKQDLARQASPINHISRDDPPFLIVHGESDRTVPLAQSLKFHEALTQGGVDATLLRVKNGGHGRFDDECEPGPEAIRDAVFGFFDIHLKGSRAGSEKAPSR